MSMEGSTTPLNYTMELYGAHYFKDSKTIRGTFMITGKMGSRTIEPRGGQLVVRKFN
jgi:hypothetical protein